ncbi:hypothetical protein OROGR_019154 [Orobanche gracilis]
MCNRKEEMDRSWMNASRASVEYENGIEQFLEFARQNRSEPNERYFCPCVKCMNGRRHEADTIREHLVCDGINTNYTVWIWHGEILDVPTGSIHVDADGVDADGVDADGDQFEEMIRDVGQESFQKAHTYDALKSDSKTPLYPGCENFTRLSAVLKLVNLKAINGWSDKSFTELLQLMSEMLLEGNTLPKRTYDAKKVLCLMGMEYKKIHACPNDCILYRKEFEELHKCPRCGVSRYKVKNDGENTEQGPPAKVLWYLPIVPRFKRFKYTCMITPI